MSICVHKAILFLIHETIWLNVNLVSMPFKHSLNDWRVPTFIVVGYGMRRDNGSFCLHVRDKQKEERKNSLSTTNLLDISPIEIDPTKKKNSHFI